MNNLVSQITNFLPVNLLEDINITCVGLLETIIIALININYSSNDSSVTLLITHWWFIEAII